MSPVKVISQQPPGGRCTLYARYADAVGAAIGANRRIVHSDCRDAHGEGFPSLWIGETALQPADGAILAPTDICTHLARIGVDASLVATLHAQLETILDDFEQNWAP